MTLKNLSDILGILKTIVYEEYDYYKILIMLSSWENTIHCINYKFLFTKFINQTLRNYYIIICYICYVWRKIYISIFILIYVCVNIYAEK